MVGTSSGPPSLSPLLLDLVATSPGLTKSALQRLAGQPWGSLSYRLAALQRAGLVDVVRDGKFTRIWPAGYSEGMRQRSKVVQMPVCGEVLRAFATRREHSLVELMRCTHRSRAAVNAAVEQLLAAHRLEAVGSGRRRFRLVAPLGHEFRPLAPAGVAA